MSATSTPFREQVAHRFRDLQDTITRSLEAVASGGRFAEDTWTYERGSGGGRSRVISNDAVFEKGGVNFSAIEGQSLPESALERMQLAPGTPFFATGVSLVIHPQNPHVPTIHMNVRYFEAGDKWWFGGGIDLTPVYPVLEDVVGFHAGLKAVCDRFGPDLYREYKAACDHYFFLPHRNETRGVGGIFFDHLRSDRERDFAFTATVGEAFPGLYIPIVEARRDTPWTEAQRDWQLLRRGRYVEFNLLWDRGTRFGIESGGRTESILMSMPATARWIYDHRPAPGSPEAALLTDFLRPRDWLGLEPA